jgi:hypothetical protein
MVLRIYKIFTLISLLHQETVDLNSRMLGEDLKEGT